MLCLSELQFTHLENGDNEASLIEVHSVGAGPSFPSLPGRTFLLRIVDALRAVDTVFQATSCEVLEKGLPKADTSGNTCFPHTPPHLQGAKNIGILSVLRSSPEESCFVDPRVLKGLTVETLFRIYNFFKFHMNFLCFTR